MDGSRASRAWQAPPSFRQHPIERESTCGAHIPLRDRVVGRFDLVEQCCAELREADSLVPFAKREVICCDRPAPLSAIVEPPG